jgi:DNA invertase Pin-like site-specific DNA recombinase
MAVIGYARVSTEDQRLDLQVAELRAAGCERVYEEKISGKSTNGREALATALDFVRDGDTLVVVLLDRLARSITDLHTIMGGLIAKGVGFKCLRQGVLDFAPGAGQDAMARLTFNMLGAFAEFEGAIRKERQREGIAKAKAAGVYKGRKASIDRDLVLALHKAGVGPALIARELKIGRASVYRLLEGAGAAPGCANPPSPAADAKALVLTWERSDLGDMKRWVLSAPGYASPYRNERDPVPGRIGHCSYHGDRRWHAEAQTGWDQCANATGGTRRAAMRRLEVDLDRRAIGMFGVDCIEFANAEALQDA